MLSELYEKHGELCASHPWEVIFATVTFTACLLSLDNTTPSIPLTNINAGTNAVEAVIMTAIRCTAVLYTYYQFCNLRKFGSKYILGIAGVFTGFSSFIFSSSVITWLRADISDLKDALFFFFLLIDLSKATILAQFALSGSTHEEVKTNIARGMRLVGPSFTLDAFVEILFISIGTLAGMRRLELLCYFACMSVIVNYIVFVTFYPACLSLILELSRMGNPDQRPAWYNKSLLSHLNEDDQKPNLVIQKVKLIMSVGMLIVHMYSRWVFYNTTSEKIILPVIVENIMNPLESASLQDNLSKWITLSAEHIIIFILLVSLTIKFIFFDGSMNILPKIEEENVAVGKTTKDIYIQTTEIINQKEDVSVETSQTCRPLDQIISVLSKEGFAVNLTDIEVEQLVKCGHLQSHRLEKVLNNAERGVLLRRKLVDDELKGDNIFYNIPYKGYDYSKVLGACCESVIGYTPIPLGVAGPLLLDGNQYYIPMATTEGCLVASTNRGCNALSKSGVISRVVADGMTRGPVVKFESVAKASETMLWINNSENFDIIKQSFDSTSSYARLTKLHVRIAGRLLFIRFVATTGDAMGMNMVSKAAEAALHTIKDYFPEMSILSLSGNLCSDKKATAVNWIEGRGKSVVCEATIPSSVVRTVLKTTVTDLVDLNINKNLIGSAVAGSLGSFNAHAANIVTAVYIATGQDPAQNTVSSSCITLMESRNDDLYISVTMPCLEVGTIGGGTGLPAQAACLEMLGVRGPNKTTPGNNARTLARIICATVLAGELSLMSALAAGQLVKSHLTHNRSKTQLTDLK